MHDLADIADWLQSHAIHHDTPVHDTLPDPVFRVNGEAAVSFSTNNYLALANHPRLVDAAKAGLERYGVGNCESRLLGGDLPVYRELERRLGRLKHTYRHADMDHLESLLKTADGVSPIIVSDGVFSMEGTIAPLPELTALAEKYGAILYIDDAHATGILGENGGGTSEHYGCYSPTIMQMGTLSKALGAIGGFVAPEREMADVLRLTSSAYGFTCPPPPDQANALLAAPDVLQEEPQRRAPVGEPALLRRAHAPAGLHADVDADADHPGAGQGCRALPAVPACAARRGHPRRRGPVPGRPRGTGAPALHAQRGPYARPDRPRRGRHGPPGLHAIVHLPPRAESCRTAS